MNITRVVKLDLLSYSMIESLKSINNRWSTQHSASHYRTPLVSIRPSVKHDSADWTEWHSDGGGHAVQSAGNSSTIPASLNPVIIVYLPVIVALSAALADRPLLPLLRGGLQRCRQWVAVISLSHVPTTPRCVTPLSAVWVGWSWHRAWWEEIRVSADRLRASEEMSRHLRTSYTVSVRQLA